MTSTTHSPCPTRALPRVGRAWWLGACLLGASVATLAQPVVCHVGYAGAARSFSIAPSAHGHTPDPVLEGARLRLEIVNRLPPAPGAGVTIRTLGLAPHGEPYLLHQASYLPQAPAVGPHGFTGLQVVREPSRGNELTYWCESAPRQP